MSWFFDFVYVSLCSVLMSAHLMEETLPDFMNSIVCAQFFIKKFIAILQYHTTSLINVLISFILSQNLGTRCAGSAQWWETKTEGRKQEPSLRQNQNNVTSMNRGDPTTKTD